MNLYYVLLYICYCFSHLIGLFSGPTLDTLDFTLSIHIDSGPPFLYFDLYIYIYSFNDSDELSTRRVAPSWL